MTVRLDENGAIRLEGACSIEDAEPLLQFLLQDPTAPVDWGACEHAHTALVQILMVARPALCEPANASFLNRWIKPIVSSPEV